MRQPWTELYVHLVWATWDRIVFLTREIRPAVYACIQAECAQLRTEVVVIGGTDDHVHPLGRIPTTISVAELAKQVKGSSSHLITHEVLREPGFKWQGGYGAFSVSKSLVPRVRDYILRQKEHHQYGTLDPELELGPESP